MMTKDVKEQEISIHILMPKIVIYPKFSIGSHNVQDYMLSSYE